MKNGAYKTIRDRLSPTKYFKIAKVDIIAKAIKKIIKDRDASSFKPVAIEFNIYHPLKRFRVLYQKR
jgi:hypothetical protein